MRHCHFWSLSPNGGKAQKLNSFRDLVVVGDREHPVPLCLICMERFSRRIENRFLGDFVISILQVNERKVGRFL